MEIWKDIQGYQGLYQISNLGNIKSFPRKYSIKNERILKPAKTSKGYYFVYLYKNGKAKMYLLHRLIAESFIPNYNNKPCINHINGIKTDNRIENLEWATYSENTKHSYKIGLEKKSEKQKENCRKLGKSLGKSILQYDLDGNFIKEWISSAEAGRKLKINQSNIIACCLNKRKKAGKSKWKYKENK